MSIYLGIDIGTSATKALACDETGRILARATAEYPVSHPKPGWSEQEPEHWWQATVDACGQLLGTGRFRAADVKGIGLSGQMHGSVFLDRRDRVIRPAILWNDQRTGKQCEEIERRAGGRRSLIRMVANPALTGFTAPKILWLREHEPRHYDRTRKVLLPKDYVRFRMTGEYATEVSDASGTLLLDVSRRRWSKRLLEKLEIDAALVPTCYESEEISGTLSATAAEQLGLPANVPVVGGGGDQAAGAVGNGIVRAGVISATMGTSGVVFAHSEQVQIDPQGRVHTFCHAVRGKWHVMGVVLAAGGSFQWFRNKLGRSAEPRLAATRSGAATDPYDLLTAEAAQAPAGSEGLFFLPYLTGERTPHADPDAKGAWIGLTVRHGRPHLVRSVLEGATYAMRDSLEIIRAMNIPVRQIRLSGGGARSPFWRQLQADVYGQKVCTINAEEGPAYGAALLAATGTGAYSTIAQACSAAIHVTSETAPDRRNRTLYNRAYPIYQSLYESLKGDFKVISELVR
jgi:xylulokinase